MARFIGIRHRTKRTAEGEARPTQVAIYEAGGVRRLKLETETDELDFLLSRWPVRYRAVEPEEDLTKFLPRHIKYRTDKESGLEMPHQVPASYEGLRPGDTVAMLLGGSGDRFAAALSRRGETIAAQVKRIPPFVFTAERNGRDKDDDDFTLSLLVADKPELFSLLGHKQRDTIRVSESLASRKDAQLARIACEQRLRAMTIGRIFLSEDGHYPEGTIEEEFDQLKANDQIHNALIRIERERTAEVQRSVRKLDVWQQVLEGVEGCGEVIAAGLIAAIGDINRFRIDRDPTGQGRLLTMLSENRLVAFCGVHVLSGGKYADVAPEKSFPRRRGGSTANWNPRARQALYLLCEQFNRRPDSVWGQRLRENKRRQRELHPEVVIDNGKKRFTDGHIHKRAMWRTMTEFVRWLYREWSRLDSGVPVPAPLTDAE